MDEDESGRERGYEGVLFDIGGVLLDLASVRAGYDAFLRRFAEREGYDPGSFADDWRAALGHHFSSREGTEYRTAREGYRRAMAVAVACRERSDADPERLLDGGAELPSVPEASWRPLFETATAEHRRPSPGAVATVRALDAADRHLGVVSDIDTREAERLLDSFGLRERFDRVTTSEAVGRTKPDPAMFEAALAGLDVAPERLLYVGDRYDHDMCGGSRAGLTTVAYGGSAAERADEDPEDVVDYAVADLRELLAVAGVV